MKRQGGGWAVPRSIPHPGMFLDGSGRHSAVRDTLKRWWETHICAPADSPIARAHTEWELLRKLYREPYPSIRNN